MKKYFKKMSENTVLYKFKLPKSDWQPLDDFAYLVRHPSQAEQNTPAEKIEENIFEMEKKINKLTETVHKLQNDKTDLQNRIKEIEQLGKK